MGKEVVGEALGLALGAPVGPDDGARDGALLGCSDGIPVGLSEGVSVGGIVGAEDGTLLGSRVGADDGAGVATKSKAVTRPLSTLNAGEPATPKSTDESPTHEPKPSLPSMEANEEEARTPFATLNTSMRFELAEPNSTLESLIEMSDIVSLPILKSDVDQLPPLKT